MEIFNWKKALENAVLDEVAGIAHAPLAGDEKYRFHVARIEPGKYIKAHVHWHGSEHYQILSGEGMMYTSRLNQMKDEPVQVTEGDSFKIGARIAHQLVNNGTAPLIVVFGCPDSHLGDDRMELEDLFRF